MHRPSTDNKPLRPVLTIGTFDGVHLGHRAILEEVKRHAAAIGGRSTVITFEPHPRQVLQPDAHIQILTPLYEKLRLLREAGMEEVSVTPFTKEFARLSAEEYVEEFLVKRFRPAAIVVGYDHRFGHDRRGDMRLLESYGGRFGFAVHELPAHMIDNAAISSTRLRKALLDGDMDGAAHMLGRPYTLTGTVVHGQKLGRTLGYPTANIQPAAPEQLVPKGGIYAVRVEADRRNCGAMLSIGTRPTVASDGAVSIEAYLFDYSGDLYGKALTVQFIRRTRDELKFDGLEALKDALRGDEAEVRGILGMLR